MIKKIFAITAVFVLAGGAVFAGEHPLIELDGRYWMPNLDADVRVVESGIGADFDAQDDLGLDDEDFPDARLIWHTGPNSKIRLGYTRLNYSGSQNVTRSIEFKGQTYTAGTLVNSDLDVDYIRLGWIWQFINMFDGRFKLGPVLEAKGIMAKVSLEAPNLSPAVNEDEDFIGGLPTLGLALDVAPIKQVNLFCEVGALYAGDYGHFIDAEAGVEIRPVEHFSIIGGYRLVDLKVEDEPDFVTMRIDGPFAGGKISF